VFVPISAVSGVFAKETGYGFAFAMAKDPVAALTAATAPQEPGLEAGAKNGPGDKADDRPKRPSHLQVIK
jgi:stringent starvation protein B